MCTTLEVEEATIGGLAMAVGMTTASHKYGLLQETVVEYEMVLGDGRLVSVRANNQYRDLFMALPWSHGSLGLLVGLTLRVVPVKPFVRVTYHPFESKAGYTSKIRELCLQDVNKSPDFIESTIFSRDRAVVMEGRFEDADIARTTATRVNNIDWWWKPWFYKHVQTFLDDKKAGPLAQQELIPTLQYIFRHNR
jgi:delta24-sterol reductase